MTIKDLLNLLINEISNGTDINTKIVIRANYDTKDYFIPDGVSNTFNHHAKDELISDGRNIHKMSDFLMIFNSKI